jgi:hypothetical protein
MRAVAALALAGALLFSESAQAWWFFFIIPRVGGGASTSAKGNICVKEGTQVGQTIHSPSGNAAKVVSVSGASSICRNPALPIRAELQFDYKFSSKAGVELPDDFQASALADVDRFNGYLLKATSKSLSNHGLMIAARTRKPNSDIRTIANAIEQAALRNYALKDTASQRPENLTINNMAAVRFEVQGTLNGVFGQRITYIYTILEGDDEIVVVNAYGPADHVEAHRPELQQFAARVGGLHAASETQVPDPVPGEPEKRASD